MPARCYRFGGLELDAACFELRRGSSLVALQPKALRLLIYLIDHRDRVVSKDELLTRLWPDAVVTEASLSKAVSAVRRALADTAESQVRVRTVRSVGFRFVASDLEIDERAASAAPPQAPAVIPAADPTFVGRSDVLALIGEACAGAVQGRGRLILLSGEAGMGKTRTAHEAAAHARTAGTRVLFGWCHEEGEAPELWPWLQITRQLLARPDAATLVDGLGDGLADLAEILPAARGLQRGTPSAGRIEAPHARFRLLDTISEILIRAARHEPYLVIVNDVHWADRPSLTLLAHLARAVPTTGLVLLATHREDELGTTHPLFELARGPGVTVHALAGLEGEHVARLVEIESGAPVDGTLAEAIRARTGGNPFFVKELARMGAAREANGGAGGDASTPRHGVASLSPGIRQVLSRRLDRLSRPCHDLLAVGALIGSDFDLALAARVIGRSTRHALALLDEALGARLIEESDGGWRFPHALVREALMERPSLAERARLHRKIAEALEAHHHEDLEPHLAELARHRCAGAPSGGAAEAVRAAQRAGDRAGRLLAYDEAAEHYRRALETLAFVARADEPLRGELLLALGEAQMVAGRPEEGRATLVQAADVARHLGLPEHLARAALASGGLELSTEVGVYDPAVVSLLEEALAMLPDPESALGVRLLVRLALARLWSSAPDRSAEPMVHAVAVARRLGDPVALGFALYSQHWSSLGPPDLDAQLAGAREMLAAARRGGHRELELAAHSCRFLALTEQGRVADAHAALDVYEDLAGQLRVPRYRWRAFFYRTNHVLLQGRFAEAEERAVRTLAEEQRFNPGDAGLVGGAQLLTLRREQARFDEIDAVVTHLADRFPRAASWRATRALAHAEMGRHAEAQAAIAALAADGFAAIPRNFNRLSGLVVLAEASTIIGDASAAARLYELLAPHRPRAVVLGAGVACWGSLDLYLGRLAATAGQPSAAARHLEDALAMNTRMGARPWVGWTEYERARLHAEHRRGTRGAAREQLARAHAVAEAHGMRRLAARVAALAAALAPRQT
jgi:DNA-binding winged helix-turn-helix (wHTH) protein/tetratricopeptide (TPR) repeat protein